MPSYNFNVKQLNGTTIPVTVDAANYKEARKKLAEQYPPVAQKVQPGSF